ncbi:MAG: hypothetical protein ABJM29_06610 [Rhizobiaceae bacterium]
MTRFAISGLLTSLMLILASAPLHAEGMLELKSKTSKQTIVPIGTAPKKKIIPLKLGSLRTSEAQLPAAPLTRSERMMLRAKRAVSRQKAVTNARRQRVAQRQTDFDQDEFPVDGSGEPVME